MTVIGVALVISGLTAAGVGLAAVWVKFCGSCDIQRFINFIWRHNEEKTSLIKTDYGTAYQVRPQTFRPL